MFHVKHSVPVARVAIRDRAIVFHVKHSATDRFT